MHNLLQYEIEIRQSSTFNVKKMEKNNKVNIDKVGLVC